MNPNSTASVGGFDELPVRARKRRRNQHVTNPPRPPIDGSTRASTVEGIAAPLPPPSQGVGVSSALDARRSSPTTIQALDVARLCGSQRIGIIGLPTTPPFAVRTVACPPGTGKSTCCLSLLMDLRHNYPIINVFSGSEFDNPFYGLHPATRGGAGAARCGAVGDPQTFHPGQGFAPRAQAIHRAGWHRRRRRRPVRTRPQSAEAGDRTAVCILISGCEFFCASLRTPAFDPDRQQKSADGRPVDFDPDRCRTSMRPVPGRHR